MSHCLASRGRVLEGAQGDTASRNLNVSGLSPHCWAHGPVHTHTCSCTHTQSLMRAHAITHSHTHSLTHTAGHF